MTLRDYRLPESPCPACGRTLDGALAMAHDGAGPSPGDVTVCIDCEALLEFGEGHTLRRLDVATLDDRTKAELYACLHLVRRAKQGKPKVRA
jgi:hypothetical protein